MALAPIINVTGSGVYVSGDDIDTDRIIPARFMKCLTFDGLGEYLFYDVRNNEDDTQKKHPLNEARFKDASILLSGSNFGCGSSREHAPQAIYRHGFRAVIAESFADIYFGNSTTLGIPCMILSKNEIYEMAKIIEANPTEKISIDVENRTVSVSGKTYQATLRDSAHQSLVAGEWDPIAELLEGMPQIKKVAGALAYV